MRKQWMHIGKKQTHRYIAGFFAILMSYQAISPCLDTAANELHKVHLADTLGKYYGQDIQPKLPLNTETVNTDTKEKVKKEALVHAPSSTYEKEQEIIEQRSENSKTYQLDDGTYISEVYFEPIHKKEGNAFVEIDNQLEKTISLYDGTPIYENKDGVYEFRVADDTMQMCDETGHELTLIHGEAEVSLYDVKENVILYSEAYPNMDMEYRLSGNRVGINFYINGTLATNQIHFTIEKGDLSVREQCDALEFMQGEEVIFAYIKPVLYDEKNREGKAVDVEYEEIGDTLEVTITMDGEWINDTNRAYPLTMRAATSAETAKVTITSAYNRSYEPNINSHYSDLYVGYIPASLSGVNDLGIARSYFHIADLAIGSKKLILSADLQLVKRDDKATIRQMQFGKTSSYVNPLNITWNNKPSVTIFSTQNIPAALGYYTFDITDYIKDIYAGKNNTLEIRAIPEDTNQIANVFFSERYSGAYWPDYRPKIIVAYRDDYDVKPDLDIDTFDSEMRIFSVLNRGFEAMSFDGIAKPNSSVQFQLVKKDTNTVIKTFSGAAGTDFMDPIYITKKIANTQTYAKDNINYTTDYIYHSMIPAYDVPYEYIVQVKNGTTTSTKKYRSDAFIKYKVKSGDTLPRIASYYGLEINQIKKDNNLTQDMVKENDTLILRFQKDNPKVSADLYTPPLTIGIYQAKFVNRGPNCAGGICPVLDPINSTTGNYFYAGDDFTIQDQEAFTLHRYYNSTGPQLTNQFGNGFTTEIESYLAYDASGNLLYFVGDGRIYHFAKKGSAYEARSADHKTISVQANGITITDLDSGTLYCFDSYGSLQSITKKSGFMIQINRDAYGAITSLRAGDKTITFHYNNRKLVSEIILPGGQKASYEYDKNRNLIKFTDPQGNTERYQYDANHFLVSITDKNGVQSTTNTYDREGRVIAQTDGNGNVSTMRYEPNKTIVTNADGSQEVYHYDANYDTTAIEINGEQDTSYTYDSYRNITSKQDKEGNITRYTYDKSDLRTIQYPDGTSEEYRYDANHNIIYHRDRDGHVTTSTYRGNLLLSTTDDQSGTTTYTYDANNRLIQERDPFGAQKTYAYQGNLVSEITYDTGLKETFAYDGNGNVIKEGDNQGKQITYVYQANGAMIQKNYQDGTKEQWSYDPNGNIITYKDRLGGVTQNRYDQNNNLIEAQKGLLKNTKAYNALNQLIKETDEQGITKTYTYDAHGNMQSEIDGYGNETRYEYDANDHLIKTTDAWGNEEINVYEQDNLIKSITKEGLETTYEYDAYNREIKRTLPNGVMERKEYDGQFLSKEWDGKGSETSHFYDAHGREIKTITRYEDGVEQISETKYDRYGNVIESSVNGVSTTYTYDVYHRQLTTTDALGHTTRKEYDLDGNVIKEIDALSHVKTTQYDALGNVIQTSDANGNTQTKTYNKEGMLISERDALGYVTTYVYNEKGQVIQTIDPYRHISEYQYDAYGNQIAVIFEGTTLEEKQYDEFGRIVYEKNTKEEMRYRYDEFGRIIEKSNEASGLSNYTEYDAYGNVVKEWDSEGLTTRYEYDEYQRKIKTIDAYGRMEELTYDVRDHIISTKQFDGSVTTNTYDARGNLIASSDALGNTTTKTYNALNQLIKEETSHTISEYTYDEVGRQIRVYEVNSEKETRYRYDANGNNIETIDALGNSTQTQYDANNQVIARIDALGNKTTKTYDANGNVIKETDALGNVRQYQYNAYGLLELEVDERGFETTYTYDDELNLIKVSDSFGYEVTMEYNEHEQKSKEIDPNDGVKEYQYDAYGRVIEESEPNGKTTTKKYDALGNVIEETNGSKTTVKEYDELGRLVKTSINGVIESKNTYNDQNQLIMKQDALGNESIYRYDALGRVIYSDEKGYITRKEYDKNGSLTKQIENETKVSEYAYDKMNRLIETKINGIVTIQKEYDGNGNEISVYEKGITKKTSYDPCNRIAEISLPSADDPAQYVVVQAFTYDESGNPITQKDAFGAVIERKYDANNNLIEEIDKNGHINQYEYDGLNHLIKAQNHDERYVTYTYDAAGDQIRKTINQKHAQYTYNENHQLIEEQDEYGYTNQYEYDMLGHKTQWIKNNGTTIHYVYDSLGNKIEENDIKYTYDSQNNLLTATNHTGTITNTYNAFQQKTSIVDPNEKEVTYRYDENQNLVEINYADQTVQYTYDDHGNQTQVIKNKEIIAEYEYNHRNELIKQTQGDIISEMSYDDMGKIKERIIKQGDEIVFHAAYRYDANDNLIEERINETTNMYAYNAYDELIESHKHINGEEITTTYQYDLYGNQVTHSTKEGTKTFRYNEQNQIERIESKTGITYLSYDENGNLSKKIHEDGQVDEYQYDEWDQLVQLEQGKDVYEYEYDAQGERITQTYTDTQDYHLEVWYNGEESYTIVAEEEIAETFRIFKEKVIAYEENPVCEPKAQNTKQVPSYEFGRNIFTKTFEKEFIRTYQYPMDEVYYLEPETTEYLVDRNREYSEVLAENERIHVYGNGLIESDGEAIITGWNGSVIGQTKNTQIEMYQYDDYGKSDKRETGHGYNQEMKDASGLIYLRARYYDPEIGRFIQIDQHYDGEANNTASQNRYMYGLNNPYKYVDRDGKRSLTLGGDLVKNPFETIVNHVVNTIKNVASAAVNAFKKATTNNVTTKLVNGATNLPKQTNNIAAAVNKKINNMPFNNTRENAKVVECPKPTESSKEIYRKTPIEIRIRESNYVFSNQGNPVGKNIEDFYHNGKLEIRGSDLYDFLCWSFDEKIDKYASAAGGLVIDLIEHEEEKYEVFPYFLIFKWYVKRKEIQVKFPNTTYVSMGVVDQDGAGAVLTGMEQRLVYDEKEGKNKYKTFFPNLGEINLLNGD